jgi:hypothetical protein
MHAAVAAAPPASGYAPWSKPPGRVRAGGAFPKATGAQALRPGVAARAGPVAGPGPGVVAATAPRTMRFALVPGRAIDAGVLRLARAELAVYVAIAYHANKSGHAWPGRERIRKLTALSLPSVKRAINGLVGHGYLHVERGGGRGWTSRYRLETGSAARPLADGKRVQIGQETGSNPSRNGFTGEPPTCIEQRREQKALVSHSQGSKPNPPRALLDLIAPPPPPAPPVPPHLSLAEQIAAVRAEAAKHKTSSAAQAAGDAVKGTGRTGGPAAPPATVPRATFAAKQPLGANLQ